MSLQHAPIVQTPGAASPLNCAREHPGINRGALGPIIARMPTTQPPTRTHTHLSSLHTSWRLRYSKLMARAAEGCWYTSRARSSRSSRLLGGGVGGCQRGMQQVGV